MWAIKSQLLRAGPVVEWLSLHAPLRAAQHFVGSNPGRGHGTAHQTTLRQHPNATTRGIHNEEYTTMDWGALGRKRKKVKSLKKKIWLGKISVPEHIT